MVPAIASSPLWSVPRWSVSGGWEHNGPRMWGGGCRRGRQAGWAGSRSPSQCPQHRSPGLSPSRSPQALISPSPRPAACEPVTAGCGPSPSELRPLHHPSRSPRAQPLPTGEAPAAAARPEARTQEAPGRHRTFRCRPSSWLVGQPRPRAWPWEQCGSSSRLPGPVSSPATSDLGPRPARAPEWLEPRKPGSSPWPEAQQLCGLPL